jgi:acetyl esterase
MTTEGPAEPLYRLIRKIRKPETLRALMASCLRSIYMGDPFTRDAHLLPEPPKSLFEKVEVKEAAPAGIRCQIYYPVGSAVPRPVMLYMHGGGFVIGCSEDTDYITRMLCHANQLVIVSINYRLAPETVFPGALEDCEIVLNWVIDQSSQLGIDPGSIYFGGDSAGGNLAAALAHRLQERRSSIRGLVLLAPWLDMAVEEYDSYNRLAPDGIVFDAAFLGYARAAYVGFSEWKNPLVSPIYASVREMPPTIALVGTEDPLLDQTVKLQQAAIESSCTQIEVEIYPGMPHCFYSFPGLFDEETKCFQKISDFIQNTSE